MHSFAPVLRSQRNAASKVSMQEKYDYDVIIIGCGVGGHGAALHARGQGLKTAIFTAADVGGTCVNRGCVPSKALLAGTSSCTHAHTHTKLHLFATKKEGEQCDAGEIERVERA